MTRLGALQSAQGAQTASCRSMRRAASSIAHNPDLERKRSWSVFKCDTDACAVASRFWRARKQGFDTIGDACVGFIAIR